MNSKNAPGINSPEKNTTAALPSFSESKVIKRLSKVLPKYDQDLTVETGWRPFKGGGRSMYQPAIDVAVGPYAVGALQYERKYDELLKKLEPILATWIRQFKRNRKRVLGKRYLTDLPTRPSDTDDVIGTNSNKNARCLVAFELENEDSRKHILGSVVNAGALGRISVLVAEQDKVLRAAIRTRVYLDYLQKVRGKSFDMSLVLVLSERQLLRSLKPPRPG